MDAAVNPIMDKRTTEDHPPSLEDLIRASVAFGRGAMIKSGIITLDKPQTCMITAIPSVRGSLLATKVLEVIAKAIAAMVNRDPCQPPYT